MCLVSVIMAVYNDESRVGRAIESVKRQTFQDWELLCIDDGSTDNTSIILDTKASLDDRIKVLHFTQNSGPGKARNIGISKALGKYICFLDSDDLFMEDSLNILYKVAEETNSEEVYFGMDHTFEDCLLKKLPPENQYFGENTEYSCYRGGGKFLYDMIRNNALSFADCRQFFLREFLRHHSIRFPEDIYSEDVPFTVEAMMHCSKLCYLRKALYIYCHRPNSITTSAVNAFRLYSMFRISMIFFEKWYIITEYSELSKWILAYLFKRYLAYSKNIYMRLSPEKRKQAKEMVSSDSHNAEMYCLLIEEQISGMFVQRINEEKISEIRSYQQVIIYGAGDYAVDIYRLLKREFIDILGFAVTEYGNNVSRIDEKPVLCIEDWLDYRDNALIIIGTARSSERIIMINLAKFQFHHVLSL